MSPLGHLKFNEERLIERGSMCMSGDAFCVCVCSCFCTAQCLIRPCIISSGSGKMMVEFFSAAMVFRV